MSQSATVTPKSAEQIKDEGTIAYIECLDTEDNPYPAGTPEHTQWLDGWEVGRNSAGA